MLEGLPGGQGLNIAHGAVDRHAAGPLANHLALRWIGKNGTLWDFSYATLRQETNQFANVLRALGVGRGDRVFALMGRARSSTAWTWSRSRLRRAGLLHADDSALHEKLGVDIAEADYPQLATLNGAVVYLRKKGGI